VGDPVACARARIVGTILVSIALVRSRRTPAWATLLFAVGIVVQLVGFTANSLAVIMVGSVILIARMSRQAMSLLAPTASPEAEGRQLANRATAQVG
jgi:hypothetical protein